MEAIVKTVNEQIELFTKMTMNFEITPKNVLPRLFKNVVKFRISYIVIYYFTLLLTTSCFSDIYPSVITTVFLMIAGMFLMKHTIAISIDGKLYPFGLELFIVALIGIPVFISLMTESFPHFLCSFIFAMLPIVAHALCFVEDANAPKWKIMKEKKEESSEDEDKKKKE